MRLYFNFTKYKNIFNQKIKILFKNETVLLGRWNHKNKTKYMEWANYDNCFLNQFNKGNKN